MRIWLRYILPLLVACMALPPAALTQSDKEAYYRQLHSGRLAAPKSDGSVIYDPPLPWPLLWGEQRTDEFRLSFDAYGNIGRRSTGSRPSYTPYWFSSSFRSPADSRVDYLWSGGLLIGGRRNDSSIVSSFFHQWDSRLSEFTPTGLGDSSKLPSISRVNRIGTFGMRTEFYDVPNVSYGGFNILPSLNVLVSTRTYVWRQVGLDNIMLFDIVISNIGTEVIEGSVLGIYFDTDICYDCFLQNGWTDDLIGSIPELGVAYAMDNDGDPVGGYYDPAQSATRAFAVKAAGHSKLSGNVAFNWWATNYTGGHDGPQLSDSSGNPVSCDFSSTLFLPLTVDSSMYCLMTNNEWDYDQIYSAETPEGWMQLPGAEQWANGDDIRLLLSTEFGDLAPDSSARVIFAAFAGRDMHKIPDNAANLPSHPDLYKSNLNFDDLIRSSEVSDSLAQTLLNPILPPIGLHAAYRDEDSVNIEWDPWVYPEVEGYEIYIAEIPDSVVPHTNVPPPWYTPTEFDDTVQVGRTRKLTLYDLDPFKMYAFRMVHRLSDTISEMSETAYLAPRKSLPAPTFSTDFLYVYEDDPVVIEWTVPDSVDVDYYNVYKFDSHDAALERFEPFYDDGFWLDSLMAVDSFTLGPTYYFYKMPVYAKIDSGNTKMFDYYGLDGNVYIVTAVDKSGRESEFSRETSVNEIEPRSKDVLVITDSYDWHNQLVSGDSIKSFYRQLLFGYDYDIYSLVDSNSLDSHWQINWHDLVRYKLVMVDDHLRSFALNADFEDSTRSFERFLATGGRMAYFGSLGGVVTNELNSPPMNHALDASLFDYFFGADSVYTTGLRYFLDSLPGDEVDTLFAFESAISTGGIMPDLSVDYRSEWYSEFLHSIWPDGSIPQVATFVPDSNGLVTHLFRSRYPGSSRQEGEPIGILTEQAGVVTYMFGFHLWYMNPADARQLVDYILFLPTDVDEDHMGMLPTSVELGQNYPNPFNPETVIAYSIPERSKVSLDVFNILGRRVMRLIDNEPTTPGNHSVRWDGRDESGHAVASGVYFYRLKVDRDSFSRKMLLLK